jgi:hypothetical protein
MSGPKKSGFAAFVQLEKEQGSASTAAGVRASQEGVSAPITNRPLSVIRGGQTTTPTSGTTPADKTTDGK